MSRNADNELGGVITELAPVPILWSLSVLQAFIEVPVIGARFESVEIQRIRISGVEHGIVLLSLGNGQLEIYSEAAPATALEVLASRDGAYAHRLVRVIPTRFEVFDCTVEQGRAVGRAVFSDVTGVVLDIEASFEDSRDVRPFVVPAPIGHRPAPLRFLMAEEFRLLPTRRSRIRVALDGREVVPKPFLVPWRSLAPVMSARCGGGLLLATLTGPHEQSTLIRVPLGRTDIGDGVTVERSESGISELQVTNSVNWLSLIFEPPLPTEPNSTGYGRVLVRSPCGRLATGRWQLAPTGDGQCIALNNVKQNWFPDVRDLPRLALMLIRWLRRRGQFWHYHGSWRSSDTADIQVEGRWTTGPLVSAGSADVTIAPGGGNQQPDVSPFSNA